MSDLFGINLDYIRVKKLLDSIFLPIIDQSTYRNNNIVEKNNSKEEGEYDDILNKLPIKSREQRQRLNSDIKNITESNFNQSVRDLETQKKEELFQDFYRNRKSNTDDSIENANRVYGIFSELLNSNKEVIKTKNCYFSINAGNSNIDNNDNEIPKNNINTNDIKLDSNYLNCNNTRNDNEYCSPVIESNVDSNKTNKMNINCNNKGNNKENYQANSNINDNVDSISDEINTLVNKLYILNNIRENSKNNIAKNINKTNNINTTNNNSNKTINIVNVDIKNVKNIINNFIWSKDNLEKLKLKSNHSNNPNYYDSDYSKYKNNSASKNCIEAPKPMTASYLTDFITHSLNNLENSYLNKSLNYKSLDYYSNSFNCLLLFYIKEVKGEVPLNNEDFNFSNMISLKISNYLSSMRKHNTYNNSFNNNKTDNKHRAPCYTQDRFDSIGKVNLEIINLNNTNHNINNNITSYSNSKSKNIRNNPYECSKTKETKSKPPLFSILKSNQIISSKITSDKKYENKTIYNNQQNTNNNKNSKEERDNNSYIDCGNSNESNKNNNNELSEAEADNNNNDNNNNIMINSSSKQKPYHRSSIYFLKKKRKDLSIPKLSFRSDCVRKRIKSLLHNYIITSLNNLSKNHKGIYFVKLPKQLIIDLKFELNNKILNMRIKDLLTFSDVKEANQSNLSLNKSMIEEIEKMNNIETTAFINKKIYICFVEYLASPEYQKDLKVLEGREGHDYRIHLDKFMLNFLEYYNVNINESDLDQSFNDTNGKPISYFNLYNESNINKMKALIKLLVKSKNIELLNEDINNQMLGVINGNNNDVNKDKQ